MGEMDAYEDRLKAASTIVEIHFSAKGMPREHEAAQKALSQVELWISVLKGRPELHAMNAAAVELDSGLHNLASGHYREAYGNLRLSIELSIAAVHFSVDELAMRQWLRDKSDIVWSNLIKEEDKERALFTVAFVSAFNDDMGGRWTQYRTLINRVHRELSTHVHGAASTSRASRELTFNVNLASNWFEKCADAHLSWQYLMLARYSDHLKALREVLPRDFCNMLADLFSTIGETAPIRKELGCN